MDNYIVSLGQELSMTKYPNETAKYYASDWNAVVKPFMTMMTLGLS
jgi:hypothetical protein